MLDAILGIFAVLLTMVGILFAMSAGTQRASIERVVFPLIFISLGFHIVALLVAMAI